MSQCFGPNEIMHESCFATVPADLELQGSMLEKLMNCYNTLLSIDFYNEFIKPSDVPQVPSPAAA